MEKKSSILNNFTDLGKLITSLKNAKARGFDVDDAVKAGKIGVAVGLPYGALTVAAGGSPRDEFGKIKKLLAAQEMQSPSGDPEKMLAALNKTESMKELAKKAMTAPSLGEALWYTTAAGFPAYQVYDYIREQKLNKQIAEERTKQKELEGKYNKAFKEQILNELEVDPAAFRQNLQTINKTASVPAVVAQNSIHPSMYLIPSLMTALGYVAGKKSSDASNPDIQRIKGYRKQLEHIMRMRDKPTFYHSEFSPEELAALEMSRGSISKKPIKPSKMEPQPVKAAAKSPISAKSDDPELQKLLGSI